VLQTSISLSMEIMMMINSTGMYTRAPNRVKQHDYTESFSKFYGYTNQLRVAKNPKRLRQLFSRAQRSVGN